MKNCWWIFRPRPIIPRPRIIRRAVTARVVRRAGTWTLVCAGGAGGVKGTQAVLASLAPPAESSVPILPATQALIDRAHGLGNEAATVPVAVPTPEAFALFVVALAFLLLPRIAR